MSEEEEGLLATIEAIRRLDPRLSPLDGVILAAVTLDIADDTRSFARLFEVEHALVIRAAHDLTEEGRWLDVVERQARTQRTKVTLSQAGKARLAWLDHRADDEAQGAV